MITKGCEHRACSLFLYCLILPELKLSLARRRYGKTQLCPCSYFFKLLRKGRGFYVFGWPRCGDIEKEMLQTLYFSGRYDIYMGRIYNQKR
jgi:hypothetical protein